MGAFTLRKNIVLIGFMGSGKSSVGRFLAKQNKTFLIDSDHLIEQTEGMSVAMIFERFGEAHFRRLEQRLEAWLLNHVQGAIVATGGGMPLVCTKLREIGKVIYLRTEFDDILKRLDKYGMKKRPLFADINAARRLHAQRDSYYKAQAHYIINANQDVKSIGKKILYLQSKGKI